MVEFESFRKIPRLSRECVVTEKIDGTNGQIMITEDNQLYVGSRNKWILTPEGLTPSGDNSGFAAWVLAHKDELIAGLGIGKHFGEWWGRKIQRGYGLDEKRFSLFNTSRWSDPAVRPPCCHVVPVLYEGPFDTHIVGLVLSELKMYGSDVAPGFMNPEGVVIFHVAANMCFKKTIDGDEKPKGSCE